jgi:uncharacterized peroxidase-related enzyme
MKLRDIERGKGVARLQLAAMRIMQAGERAPDVVRVLLYRPDFFGRHLNGYVDSLLRGPSEWTIGERELFASYVSHCNECQFCYSAHRAVAERALGADIVAAVFRDLASAPVSNPVRAVLNFLEKLTKSPADVTLADLKAVLAAGVSRRGLEVAIHISAAFTTINRVADSMGFEVPSASGLAKAASLLLKHGYRH